MKVCMWAFMSIMELAWHIYIIYSRSWVLANRHCISIPIAFSLHFWNLPCLISCSFSRYFRRILVIVRLLSLVALPGGHRGPCCLGGNGFRGENGRWDGAVSSSSAALFRLFSLASSLVTQSCSPRNQGKAAKMARNLTLQYQNGSHHERCIFFETVEEFETTR